MLGGRKRWVLYDCLGRESENVEEKAGGKGCGYLELC